MPLLKRLGAALMAAVVAVSGFTFAASADEPYEGYNYDWWGDPIPSQNGYVVDKVITGVDLGVDSLSEPNDMFVNEETGKIYLVDTKNNRIVITDPSFSSDKVQIMDKFVYADGYKNAAGEDLGGQETTLRNPKGIYVLNDEDQVLIYIADYDNNRVIACYEDGTVWMEYTRPSSDVYDAEVTFQPSKVVVDKAKNVYICIKSITKGAVQFAQDGSFNGYYGANRVEQTAEVIANAFWKLIFSREQVMKMKRNVSIEFSNFDIDQEGFIYTVTESKSSSTDILKKMNSAGSNIFTNLGYDQYTYGDYASYYWNGKTYASAITDVEVDSNGNILLLDMTTCRIFQYDDECDLLFIFGGTGSQKGLFTSPTAIESYGDKVYVLDGRKNSITVYKQTEFGSIVHNAIKLFNKGLYDEARGPWEEVLSRDSNYWFAYIGIGNAHLNDGEYEEAMKYFYRNTRGGYNRAFKGYRIEFIRANFNVFLVAILVIIIGLVVLNHFLKKRKKKKALMEAGGK